MVNSKFLLSVLTALIFACTPGKNQLKEPVSGPVTVEASGYIVPKDSLSGPEIVPAGKPITVRVGKLEETQEVSIRIPLSSTEIINLSLPRVKTIGTKGVAMPKVVEAKINPVYCKAPELVAVKDFYVKDINPYNFSSLSKLQGLRHDQVRSLIQDKMGNIWLGTDDGLTKYDGKYFSHYTTNQGLNNNLILSLLEDSKGNIWFGTFRGGVTKYDGKYLTNFSTNEGLPDNVVNCIFEDKAGNIWLGTGKGAVKFDGKNFTTYTDKDGLFHNDVRAIIEDKQGIIWIGTYGGGYSLFDGKSFSNFTENPDVDYKFISTFFKDNENNIWIGTANNGVLKYNGTNYIRFSIKEGLTSNNIRSIFQDKEGNIWIATADSGISKFDGKFFTNYSTAQGLGSNYIRSTLQDNNGNIWFGTRGAGLTKFDGELFNHYTEYEGIANNRVMNILEDKSGVLWFGTYGGYITICTTKEINGVRTKFFSPFGKNEGLLSSRIYSIMQDREGNIWFGTDGGGFACYNGKTTVSYTTDHGLSNNSIRKIYQDREGFYWIATYGSGVSKFDGTNFYNYSTKEGLSSNNILTIMEDSKGKMWFGTDGGGITCFDGENFIHYTSGNGFFNDIVYSIIEDRDGNLWFGTGGDGVVKFDGQFFTKYASESGLNNNHVLSLTLDSHNNIWAGTRLGLNVITADKLNHIQKNQGYFLFKSFNYEDGFIGMGCNLGAITEDKTGTLWIGTNDRLTEYNGENLKSKNDTINLQITKIQLFNENIPWTEMIAKDDTTILLHNGVKVGKFKYDDISAWYGIPENLSLSHRDNYLTFNYAGIAHNQIKKIKYQYKLDGLDKDWNIPTDRTEVSYGNLKQGNYIFRVKAINSEGLWSKAISYSFTIRPPWWNTWWFYSLLSLVVIVAIYSIIKYRVRKLNKDKELLEMKVKEQTQELVIKNDELQVINLEKDKLFSIIAHDLRGPFSTFLGLTQIMAEEINDFTIDEIKEFATGMNTTATNIYSLLENLLQWSRMQQSSMPFNPAPLNLRSLVSGSEQLLTQVANEKNIELVYKIENDIACRADSNMLMTIIRNLVSNAIKFTPKGGKVSLSAKKDKQFIEISVKDNGIGMSNLVITNLFRLNAEVSRLGTEGEPSTGLGLQICKGMVEKHGGKLWAKSKEGTGSEFFFTIPADN